MEVEAGAEEDLPKSKSPSANPPKSPLRSHSKIFTTAKWSSSKTREPDAARSAAVRAVKTSKHANSAKAKVWSSKCTKWAPACISKSKSTAISVEEREKSSLKVESVKNVRDKRSWKRTRLLRFLLRRVCLRISPSPFREKEMSFLKPWLET